MTRAMTRAMTRVHRGTLVFAGGALGGAARAALMIALPAIERDVALSALMLLAVNASGSLAAGLLVGWLKSAQAG